MFASQNVDATEADTADTFRTGIAIFESADSATGSAIYLNDPRVDGAGVGVGEGGRGHVEVST